MAKDPAFLFYPNDWLGGTMSFSRHHKGAYMDLLMAQFNQGRLSIEDIKDILGSDFEIMWERKLKGKFLQDENKLFYNKRLEDERNKRKNYAESRRNNLKKASTDMGAHMNTHMENINKNVNEGKNKIENRIAEFSKKVDYFKDQYEESMLLEFFNYWSERNEGGKRMRFEMQKVFDVSRRLQTWSKNQNKFISNGKQQQQGNQLGSLEAAADRILRGER